MIIEEAQAINSFFKLESSKEVYGLIWLLIPILTLVLGITIGVLMIYARPLGILQALADGVKLLFKEDLLSRGDIHLFSVAPSVVVISILLSYSVIPFGHHLVLTDLSIDFLSGYGSNNKYSFSGGLRAAAQSISYEIPLTVCVLSISLLEAQSKYGFWGWNLWRQPIGFIVFIISSLAECERFPFDLSKVVEELVAGYQTKYSGIKFGLFYVACYLNLLVSSLFVTVLYLGGWNLPIPYIPITELFKINQTSKVFGTTISLFITLAEAYLFLFIPISTRWTLPRLKMDQLLKLGWKSLLPIALSNLLLTTSSQLVSL
ncbi:unnamed protein product [Victoria cruziana]